MTEVDTIMRDGVVSVPTPAPGQKNKADDTNSSMPSSNQILLGEQQQNGMKSDSTDLTSDADEDLQRHQQEQQTQKNTLKTSDESLNATPEQKTASATSDTTTPSSTLKPTIEETAPTSSSTENGDSIEIVNEKSSPPKTSTTNTSPKPATVALEDEEKAVELPETPDSSAIESKLSPPLSNVQSAADVADEKSSKLAVVDDGGDALAAVAVEAPAAATPAAATPAAPATTPATGNSTNSPQKNTQNDVADKPPDKDDAEIIKESDEIVDDVVDLDTTNSSAMETDEVAPTISLLSEKEDDDEMSSSAAKVGGNEGLAKTTTGTATIAPTVTPMECDESDTPMALAISNSSSISAANTTTTTNIITNNNNNNAVRAPPTITNHSSETLVKLDVEKKTANGGSKKVTATLPASFLPAPATLPPKIDNIDSNVVNLDDDDSDVEMDVPRQAVHAKPPLEEPAVVQITPVAVKTTNSINTIASNRRSLSNDSDGAVVIGSDSETETTISPAVKTALHKNPASSVPAAPVPVSLPTAIVDDDDDDDDCVVIEDETTAPPHPHSLHGNDFAKRKSMAMDGTLDDSQPPNKRQRGGTAHMSESAAAAASVMGLNQITIKDARSLLPHDAFGGAVKKGGNIDASIYPMNLSAASAGIVGPPKLMSISNAAGNTAAAAAAAASLPLGGGGLNANANLLPGLTDDMFVLEAPSFIVPYIYEKPPTDVLRDVVRDIEAKYELSKEDLADADKSDEFDMMTEQNKEDKDEKDTKKKSRKRRGGDDPDESWSEDSDDDDDDDEDDDSESGVRTKVLIKEAVDDFAAFKGAIKPAAAVAQSPATGGVVAAKPGQENYFESPLGKFFMDIGVGFVQEFVQSDLIRLQKRKMRKSLGKNITEFERAITALSGNLEASKKKNSPFKFTMKRCEFCNFKSESALAMANHYETPHMNGPLYKCNFCTFEIRNATEIVYHMEAMHNIKARLIKPLPYHQCPNCGFEDNGKAKLARHQPVCAKKFRPELNLGPPNDWEAPAKIPRIKPRHGLVGTATAYQAMAAQAAAHKAALATLQQQQQQVAQVRNMQAAVLAQQTAAANKIRGRPPQVVKSSQISNIPTTVPRGTNQVRTPITNNAMLTNNYQVSGGQLIPAGNLSSSKKTLAGQPSISITPLPRQNVASQQQQQQQQSSAAGSSSASTSKMPPSGVKPGQNPNSSGKAQFVICEICDGYIKDLEQLRNHMQWMHKVKIHPKMIYNRPPLNCQKCQFRFFTDQGLERHLLGSHGLVTSSMQEAANKGKDAGRCPVCGRMYQWKLLNHVSRDHHMTLKPAHLSYKCTVCTATFGMYKQFETHVYTAHSTVAKKAIDGKKSNSTSSSGGGGSGGGIGSSGSPTTSQRINLSATNDSLLKPLKINDEITIIPQPSSKPRIMNMESHVID